jgi:hypothetical protein
VLGEAEIAPYLPFWLCPKEQIHPLIFGGMVSLRDSFCLIDVENFIQM